MICLLDSIEIAEGDETRRDELYDNKKLKGNYHPRIMLKDISGFAEHQEKLHMGSVIIYK